jgi:hypothetical protein
VTEYREVQNRAAGVQKSPQVGVAASGAPLGGIGPPVGDFRADGVDQATGKVVTRD